MAIKALDISKIRDYICKDDDPADPTIWKLGTLSARDKGAIQDTMTSFSFTDADIQKAQARKAGKDAPESVDPDDGETLDTKIEKSKMNWEAVRRGLRGWENYLAPDGTPMAFKTIDRDVGGGVVRPVVPNSILNSIPYDVLSELAEELLKESADEEDAGNSQGPSSEELSIQTEDVPPAPQP